MSWIYWRLGWTVFGMTLVLPGRPRTHPQTVSFYTVARFRVPGKSGLSSGVCDECASSHASQAHQAWAVSHSLQVAPTWPTVSFPVCMVFTVDMLHESHRNKSVCIMWCVPVSKIMIHCSSKCMLFKVFVQLWRSCVGFSWDAYCMQSSLISSDLFTLHILSSISINNDLLESVFGNGMGCASIYTSCIFIVVQQGKKVLCS